MHKSVKTIGWEPLDKNHWIYA